MMSPIKLIFLSVGLVFIASCASTNPQNAFDDLGQTVHDRAGHELRWTKTDSELSDAGNVVASLLETNLTLRSAIEIALLNNRSLQAEFEEIGVSQAELAQATRLRNPEIEGSWRLPIHGANVVNAEYTLAQNFLDLLMLPARKEIAARNLESSKLRIADRTIGLIEEVQSAFYTVQADQQLTNRLALIVEVNEAAADIAKRQRDAGNIPDVELLNQQAAFAQSRLDLARASAQLRSDREKLNRLLGLWGPQTAWQISDNLPGLPDVEPPLDEIESLAVSQRFDLGAARAQTANVHAALKLKKDVRWLPALSVGVGAEHDLDHSWVVGPSLALEVPIFDQGQAELARLAAEYRRAARNFEALAINARSEAREARDALIAARDVAEYYNKVLLPQRQVILRETLLQYNAMQIGNFVLLSARERQASVEREAIESLRDYWIARAHLNRAVGGSLAPLSSDSISAKPHDAHSHTHNP